MKLLFLNLWQGKLLDSIESFLKEQQPVDIFCFQEMPAGLQETLDVLLPGYQVFTSGKHISQKVYYDQAIYVHPRLKVGRITELLMEDQEVGLALALTVADENEKQYTIINLHGTARAFRDGVWQNHDDKRDFPARIRQLQVILDFAKAETAPVIIGGDFNISPDTESIELLRRAGYRDLIREYTIPTTRNHFSWDRFPESPKENYLYSDYIFVDPNIQIKNFDVPKVEVSDHLPMILEIEFSL